MIIIFDIGGVLLKGSIHKFYDHLIQKLNVSGGEFSHVKNRYIDAALIGKISADEFIRNIAADMNIDEDDLRRQWRESFCEAIKIDDDVLEIIKSLKGEHKVVALTNVVEFDTITCRERGDYELFDEVFTSWELHSTKPGHEIYRKVLRALHAEPKECVFIDDAQENVDAATAVGIRGIHFMNPTQLKTDLRRLVH